MRRYFFLCMGNNIVMFMSIDIDFLLVASGTKGQSMKPSSGSPDSDGVLEIRHYNFCMYFISVVVFTVGEGLLHGCGVYCR